MASNSKKPEVNLRWRDWSKNTVYWFA